MVGAGTRKDGDVHDPAHWRRRAEEARRHAAGLADPVAQETLLGIAQAYEQLALNARRGRASPTRSDGRQRGPQATVSLIR